VKKPFASGSCHRLRVFQHLLGGFSGMASLRANVSVPTARKPPIYRGFGLVEGLVTVNPPRPISGPYLAPTDLPNSTTTLTVTYPVLTTTYCFSAAGNYAVPIDSLIPPANDEAAAGRSACRAVRFETTGGSSVKPTHYKAKLISRPLDKWPAPSAAAQDAPSGSPRASRPTDRFSSRIGVPLCCS